MMIRRDQFIDSFNSNCYLFSNNIAISFNRDDSLVGMTYSCLSDVCSHLQNYFESLIPTTQRIYIGVCASKKRDLIPIIIAIWKMKHACIMISEKTSYVWCKKDTRNPMSCLITDLNHFSTITKGTVLETFALSSTVFSVFQTAEFPTSDQFLEGTGDMCFALTTSGSTGDPKRVRVPWLAILGNAWELAEEFQVHESDVIASMAPCTFDPFFIELFMSLLKGSNLFVNFPVGELKTDSKVPNNIATINVPTVSIQTQRVTILQATPSIYRMMRCKYCSVFKHLRVLILGGETFPTDFFTHEQYTNKDCKVYDIYGITEASCWAFLTRLSKSKEFPTKVLHGIEIKVSEDGMLSLKCNERICDVDGDFGPERATGDVVECTPKKIHVKGRIDHMIKKFGNKIFIETSDKALSGCSDVKNHCIVYEPELQILGWFVEVDSTQEGSCSLVSRLDAPWVDIINELDELERPNLIIKICKLPLTEHGKTNVKMLRENLKEMYQINQTMKNIWCEVLGLKQFIAEKTFHQCGGTSSAAMQLLTRLDAIGKHYTKNMISKLLLGDVTFQQLENELISYPNKIDTDARGETQTDNEFPERAPKMTVKWIYEMNKCVDASPQLITIDGVKFVAVGSHSSQLGMVNCESGEVHWTTYLGDRIQSGIAVSDDQQRLYTGCYDHHVYCISTRSGVIVWKYQTGAEVKSTPVLSQDGRFIYCGSYDKRLYCLNQQDGTPVMSYEFQGSVSATPLLFKNLIIVATLDGSCTALTTQSFSRSWHKKFKSPIFSSPCILNEHIYVCEVEGTIYCLSGDSGDEKLHIDVGCHVFSGLTPISGGIVFGGQNSKLYIIFFDGTSVRSRHEVNAGAAVPATPAVSAGAIVCAASCGSIILVDLHTFHPLASIQLNNEIFSSPILDNDLIFVGCRDDRLYCIQIENV